MKYLNASYTKNGMINCTIDHPEFGEIEITLSADDPDTEQMFHEAVSTSKIEEYVEKIEDLILEKNNNLIIEINSYKELLSATDYKELPSYMDSKTSEENEENTANRISWREKVRELEKLLLE